MKQRKRMKAKAVQAYQRAIWIAIERFWNDCDPFDDVLLGDGYAVNWPEHLGDFPGIRAALAMMDEGKL